MPFTFSSPFPSPPPLIVPKSKLAGEFKMKTSLKLYIFIRGAGEKLNNTAAFVSEGSLEKAQVVAISDNSLTGWTLFLTF